MNTAPFYLFGILLIFGSLMLQVRLAINGGRANKDYNKVMLIVCVINSIADILLLVGNLMDGSQFWALWFGVLTICNIAAVVYFWRKRPPRKRVSKLIGEKAKAIKAKLVETARKLQPTGGALPVPA